MNSINCLLGDAAPPYIIIAISITLIAAISGILHQYKTFNVDIYEVKYGDIQCIKFNGIKLSTCIKFMIGFTIFLLMLSLSNIMINFDGVAKEYLHVIIKISLIVSSWTYVFFIFEYWARIKEELAENR
jgi:hypothetical protein